MKETVIWRVWGGAFPSRSLVKKSDHSFTLASWYPQQKIGRIYTPSGRKRLVFRSYNAWLKNAAKYFDIENKTISW